LYSRYLKAAEQGHAEAQYRLGRMLADGRAADKGMREALTQAERS
jgi:TPR repeat protein